MPTSTPRERVARALHLFGLLLEADPELPSVTLTIAEQPIRGSWWGHPDGGSIFATCEWLQEHEDVLSAKLVNGKITYVHRRLWSALLRVATSNRSWQKSGLSGEARALLHHVGRRGSVRTDKLKQSARALRQPVQELERRLLVRSFSVHTGSGKHAKQLESWRSWKRRSGFEGKRLTWPLAVAEIEAAGAALCAASGGARVRFPWQD